MCSGLIKKLFKANQFDSMIIIQLIWDQNSLNKATVIRIALLTLQMMIAESMLSKHPVSMIIIVAA